jgi:hypothetical protein
MALSLPAYCTREDVKLAPDFAETARGNSRIDRAIDGVSRLIEGELHRVFYPQDATRYFDWPNQGGSGGGQYANPWRLWLDQNDLVSLSSLVTGGVTISTANVFLEPINKRPGEPYRYLELDRSSSAAFGGNAATPQRAIAVTGTWGFTADTDAAGTLAAAVASTSATTVTVSDGSQLGVGDLLIVDSERLLVTERAAVTTGQTNLSGATSASAADNAITVTDGTQVHLGEVLLIDSERLLIEDITGNVVTVRRAWDGTLLATHTTATTLYAYRLLTVARGQLGTTAATHSNSAPVSRHRPPGLIRDLCIAESVNRVLQETSGYARTVGEGGEARPAPGVALADLWDEAVTRYGRKARIRAV